MTSKNSLALKPVILATMLEGNICVWVFPDGEYNRQKKLLEMELESLVVPAADAAEEAGKLILNLPKLWIEANLEERRKLLLSMLDAVYVDARQTKSIVAIKPKPPFRPIFQVAVTRVGSKIHIVNEPLGGSSVFLVETGESRSLPETMLSFVGHQTQKTSHNLIRLQLPSAC